jgi:hypothetical protein
MAAIARVFSRKFSLKLLAIFCGVGLPVSMLLMTYGVDLSPGFF